MKYGTIDDIALPPRWLHLWCLITVASTFVLLLLGAVVKTFEVGMADPVWPTTPWYLLFISWQEPSAGFLIEHSHRFAGWVVGCLIIVLAAGLWLQEPRRWVCWLGMAALIGVIIQGILGGMRVVLNEWFGRDFAMIHGVFAQVVLGMLVTLAFATSRRWQALGEDKRSDGASARVRRWAVVLSILMFCQIVAGVLLRHTHSMLGKRSHLLLAFAVFAVTMWLLRVIYEHKMRALFPPTWLMVGILCLQIVLGVETWLVRYSTGVLPEMQRTTIETAVIRTAHVLTGYCLMASSVLVTLTAYRATEVPSSSEEAEEPKQLEGVV